MGWIEELCRVACLLVVLMFASIIIIKNHMERQNFNDRAIRLAIIAIILLPMGSGMFIYGLHHYGDCHDVHEEKVVHFDRINNYYIVRDDLSYGDVVEITFQSTTPLDVDISHSRFFDDNWLRELASGMRSGNLSYEIRSINRYRVRFHNSDNDEGTAEISVKFDRSASRTRTIIFISISCAMIVGSLAILFLLDKSGKELHPPKYLFPHNMTKQ